MRTPFRFSADANKPCFAPVVPGFRMRSGYRDLISLCVHRPVGLVLGGGGGATLAALPMPLGSLTELLAPPTLPGPDGMPLTPVVPAPAEPAFGVPTALPDPAGAPVLWANELNAPVKPIAAASARVVGAFDIGRTPGWDRCQQRD
jgi:hypothetical protein